MVRATLWMHWLLGLALLVLCGCGGAYASVPMTAAPGEPMAELEAEASDDGVWRDEAGVAGMPAPSPAPPPVDARKGAAAPHKAKPAEGSAPVGHGGDMSTPPETPEGAPNGGQAAAGAKVAAPLLIYKAKLHMGVYEAAASIDAAHKLATEAGGYLVRRDDRSITVRVPAEQFRKLLAAISKLGDVQHREETVEDVTDEFYDLKVRLDNARAMRQRLEQLLEQAKNVEEALAVEKELGRITEQIERYEGRLKLLRELISFSTITVVFEPRPVDEVGSQVLLPFPWLNQLGLTRLLSL